MNLYTKHVDLLARVANVTARRHETIAVNIANANTPGYKAKVIAFEAEFSAALKESGPAAALEVEAQEVTDETTPARADGNNVLMEKEIGAMYRNSLASSVFTELLKARLGQLRSAIMGR